jgi:RHS repeat-associated protein
MQKAGKGIMLIQFFKRYVKTSKKLSIIITLLFYCFALIGPNFVHATETTPPTPPDGIQLNFSQEGNTFQSSNMNLKVLVSSNQQIDSTSVSVRLDGHTISSDFQYKGHWENPGDEYWEVESYLEGTVSSYVSNLKDGHHVLSVTAADISGDPITKEWSFQVQEKPKFSNPSISNGQDTHNNNGFSIKVTDNDEINQSSINVMFDGNLVPATFNSSTGIITYIPETGLSDGSHTININLEDVSGNAASYGSSFTVCTSGPHLTFDKAEQTLTKIQSLTVDIQSIIKLNNSDYTIKLNGQPIYANFSYPVGYWDIENFWIVEDYKVGRLTFTPSALNDGIQTLEVTAKDHLGTSTTQSWNFTVNIKPEMGTPVPANNSFTNNNSGFNLKITDNTSVNPNSIVATLDGEEVPVTFNSTTGIISYETTTPITDGLHHVNVTAADTAGNQSSYSWSYTILTTGPNLELVQSNQQFLSIPNLTVNLTSETNLSDKDYTFKVDGQTVNPQFEFKGHWISEDEWSDPEWVVDSYKEGTLTFTPGSLTDGLHTVEVTAKDALGNSSTQNWNFNLSMKPEFSFASPVNGAQTIKNSGFSVKVVDYNDGFSGSSSFVVKLNGEVVDAQYDQTTKILSYNAVNPLPDGNYTVHVVATDMAGTQSEYSWNFTVKTVGPGIEFIENGQSFTINPTLTFKLQSNTDISQSEFSLKIDGNLISPSYYTITFLGHWEERYDEEYEEYYDYYVVDSYKEATVTTKQLSLFNGSHTLEFSAKDVQGNNTMINGEFTTEGTYTLDFTRPDNQSIIKGSATISATTNLSYMNVSVRKYGTNLVQDLGNRFSQTGSWNWDTSKINDGEYTIILTGYDAIGQPIQTERNVTVANVQPGLGFSHWGTVENYWGHVNIANGNFIVEQTDIQLPGKGLGTEFSRVYNSQLKTNGVLGWGWRINLPELAEYQDHSVEITDGDGSKYIYTLEEDGTYKRPAGKYEILSKNTDNNFELNYKDGRKYIFDTANNQTILKDKNGNAVTYQYDNSNRLISITDSSGRVTSLTYNTSGKLASVKDYASRTWTYSYDTKQNLIRVTNPLSKNISFFYDLNHQLTSITDGNGKKTTYTYSSNKLTGMTDPLNKITNYSYDPNTNKFTETDPLGNQTTLEYDSNWNVISLTNAEGGITKTTYDDNFNVTSQTDALNRKTTYTYDFMGNVLSETDPMNNTVSFVYDQDSNLIAKTDAMGNITNYVYDANGNLVTDGVTVNTYNPDGTVSKVIDAKGNESSYTYDDFGNIITFTDALGKETKYTYNSLGLKLTETDPLGSTTQYTYDNLGRMLTVTVPDGITPKTTTYTYDGNGNRLTARDAAGNVSTWTYDGLNRVISLIEPGNMTTSYTYDANGNRISETTPDGKVTSYTYDVMNRVTLVNKPDLSTVSYSYDKENNVTQMVESNGATVNFEYNDNNLLTKETSSTGKVITYSYDKNGQRTGKTVDGVTVGLSETYNYVGDNLTSLVSNGVTTDFSYDANKNRTGINYANNTAIKYSYDDLNRITSVINQGVSGNTLSSYGYTYYDNGQIKSVTDSSGETIYEYDSQNRLIKIIEPTGKTTSYTFDEVGNRTSETITENGVTSTTSYTYDVSSNQLLSVSKPDGSTVSFTYDANGNTLSKTDNTGATSYEYNSNNQLTKVTKPNGDIIEYAYDGNNKRISKTINGVITKYVYDGDRVIQETDESDNVQTTYVFDDNGSPISIKKGSNIYNYLYNGHGDVVALTDSDGNIVSTFEFDVWGNVIAKTGSVDSLYGYAGQFGYVFDQETGFYFLQSRYYDPGTGRFISADRFKGFEDRPASQNKYTYCENDPVNGYDPQGTFTTSQYNKVINFLNWISAIFATISVVGFWLNPVICGQAGTVSYYAGWLSYIVYIGKAYHQRMKVANFITGSVLSLIGQFTAWYGGPIRGLFTSTKLRTLSYFIARYISIYSVASSL